MKRFKKGDRVYHPEMGYGTVDTPTYNTIHFTTWTCVKYDDYLNQAFPLCGETEELTLVQTYQQTMELFQEAVSLGFSPKQVIEELEQHDDTNPKALDTLRNTLKYGI